MQRHIGATHQRSRGLGTLGLTCMLQILSSRPESGRPKCQEPIIQTPQPQPPLPTPLATQNLAPWKQNSPAQGPEAPHQANRTQTQVAASTASKRRARRRPSVPPWRPRATNLTVESFFRARFKRAKPQQTPTRRRSHPILQKTRANAHTNTVSRLRGFVTIPPRRAARQRFLDFPRPQAVLSRCSSSTALGSFYRDPVPVLLPTRSDYHLLFFFMYFFTHHLFRESVQRLPVFVVPRPENGAGDTFFVALSFISPPRI